MSHELRVFVVGAQVIGYRVDKLDSAQLWAGPEVVLVDGVELSSDLATKLVALCRYRRLDVAAFDLLVRGDDVVSLEVNVNCAWRWFEQRADRLVVSEAAHSWVRDRFESLSDSASVVGRGRW